jgi:hypothetical protein
MASLFGSPGDLHPDFFLLDIKRNFGGALRVGDGRRE